MCKVRPLDQLITYTWLLEKWKQVRSEGQSFREQRLRKSFPTLTGLTYSGYQYKAIAFQSFTESTGQGNTTPDDILGRGDERGLRRGD